MDLTLIVLGGGLNTPQLSKSSIIQRIHLDATLNPLVHGQFSRLIIHGGGEGGGRCTPPNNIYGIWKSQEVSCRGRLKIFREKGKKPQGD